MHLSMLWQQVIIPSKSSPEIKISSWPALLMGYYCLTVVIMSRDLIYGQCKSQTDSIRILLHSFSPVMPFPVNVLVLQQTSVSNISACLLAIKLDLPASSLASSNVALLVLFSIPNAHHPSRRLINNVKYKTSLHLPEWTRTVSCVLCEAIKFKLNASYAVYALCVQ